MEGKVLVTGASGFVGARIMAALPFAEAIPGVLYRNGMDQLSHYLQEKAPQVILHTAAISSIAACEKAPEQSFIANVQLPLALAAAAKEIGSKLLCFSTDQVYTGCPEGAPYKEDSPLPPPANVYARHKLEAEQRVLDLLPQAVMLRATWMYDMPLYAHANRSNFLVNALLALLHGGPWVVPQHYRGITYVRQLAAHMQAAMDLPGGVYNFGSEAECTVPEMAHQLLCALGAGDKADHLLQVGEKRHDLWMDCGKLRACGIVFDSTLAGFLCCIRDYAL